MPRMTSSESPDESTPVWCASEPHESIDRKLGVDGALAELNELFLSVHASARLRRCRALSREGLVIRYAAGELEARFRGRVLHPTANILPPDYHALKSVAHALFLAAILASEGDDVDPGERKQAVAAIEAIERELGDPKSTARRLIPEAHVARQHHILALSRAALGADDGAGARKAIEEATPALQQVLAHVATEQVRALHHAVQAIRAEVEREQPDAWDSLLVVVAVAHQARAESLEVQYFERLLREPRKEGALGERRLVVAEGASEPAAQIDLLAAHLVDQLGGRLIFGDKARLQRDVLSDHVGELERLLPRVSDG